MDSSRLDRDAITECNTYTWHLVQICFQRKWWFRLFRGAARRRDALHVPVAQHQCMITRPGQRAAMDVCAS